MGYKEFVAIFILCVAGCNKNDNPVVNHPVAEGANSAPVIQTITFIPDTVIAGESCLVKCQAFDADNDRLDFEWVSVGNISSSGSTIIYTPSACCGAPEIIVTVKDGRGGRIDSQFTVPFKYE